MPKKTNTARDIGIDVAPPKGTCDDRNCPFHGTLSVRGQILNGVVVSTKMKKTVVVERKYMMMIDKYERLEKRTRRLRAHSPACLGISTGDEVTLIECRPLSKTVSFVVIEKRRTAA